MYKTYFLHPWGARILVFVSLENLDTTLETMMVLKEGVWLCINCEYCSPIRSRVRNHVEAKHVSHTGFVCDHCDKVFKTRHSLRNHISTYKLSLS